MIEELETSLDKHAQLAVSSVSSCTIDDQVLRQLFMSYFTADKDKQPEIAVLLASVLGYSQEVVFLNPIKQLSYLEDEVGIVTIFYL